MKSNDMSVDTSAFNSISGKIRKKCEDLTRLSEAMSRNLMRVNEQFTSVNFYNARDVINGIQADLSRAIECMDNLKRFFDELEYCTREYANNAFRG